MKKYFFYGAVFFLLFTIQIFAQNPTPTPGKETVTEADEENSDLVITANIRAKELRVEVVPTPTVKFPGNGQRQTVWEADRTNLPQTVEPGVVYRDIGIRLRIYSRFSEIQRIVLEALDENEPLNTTPTPQTSNNQTTQTTPETPSNQSTQPTTPTTANQTNQPATPATPTIKPKKD